MITEGHDNAAPSAPPLLVSACLLGEPCRYDAASKPHGPTCMLAAHNPHVSICPECLGGLPTPRSASEIQPGGSVLSVDGKDRSEAFALGARRACSIAHANGCAFAILKSKSPSCGIRRVYDGSFTRTLQDGMGIAARALADTGLPLLDEHDTVLETPRLYLRPWTTADAAALYECARDKRVGPAAGWPPHESVAHSAAVIESVLSAKEVYAIVLKETGRPVGSIGLMGSAEADVDLAEGECEIGYWIGTPYWGRGLVPEAGRVLLERAFRELDVNGVWCACDTDNTRSLRVARKLGFRHVRNEALYLPHVQETRSATILYRGRHDPSRED